MNFVHKAFIKDDDYMTPQYAWENIKQYIPKDKIIWEAFYGDGESGKILTELGFNTIHNKEDFFTYTPEYDILVSNPPFGKIKEILKRLYKLDKPFILILPSSKINTQYFRLWKNKIQIIIPPKRISFIKKKNKNSHCNFDCFYYCYKMNFKKDIIWIN